MTTNPAQPDPAKMSDDEINQRILDFMLHGRGYRFAHDSDERSKWTPANFCADLNAMALVEVELERQHLAYPYSLLLAELVFGEAWNKLYPDDGAYFDLATATARQRAEAAVRTIQGMEKSCQK